MTGWIDRLPTWARDLLLMLVATVTMWAGSDIVPLLEDRGGASALVASVLVLALATITKWTQAYGRGKNDTGQSNDSAE